MNKKMGTATALMGLAAFAGILSGCGSNMSNMDVVPSQVQSAEATNEGALLFVVESQSGTIAKAEDGKYTLTLSGLDTDLVWFNDRPVRDAGKAPIAEIANIWTIGGANSFANDAPNAAITVHAADGSSMPMVAELGTPVFSKGNTVITFTVTPINGQKMKVGTFTGIRVFIDDEESTEQQQVDGAMGTEQDSFTDEDTSTEIEPSSSPTPSPTSTSSATSLNDYLNSIYSADGSTF